MQDLDQIDELDETNPWGIPIHHDGPYEAANAQVNKRAGNRVPLGLANNGLYNAHALQANGQVLHKSSSYVVYFIDLCSIRPTYLLKFRQACL